MFRLLLFSAALFLTLAPHGARAFVCEDLWYTRNAILDRAGMCFGSVLGQAIFDNTGCTGTSVQLAPEFAQFVNALAQQEQREGCRIDTSQPVLNLPDLAIRQRLVELPVAGDSPGFNCIGWRGGALPLYSARSETSAPVGRIDPGDFVGMWNSPGPNWVYVLTYTRAGGPLKSGGWMQPGLDPNLVCGEQVG